MFGINFTEAVGFDRSVCFRSGPLIGRTLDPGGEVIGGEIG